MFGLSPSASLIWAKSSTPLVMASSSALALVKNTAAALACSGQLPPAMSAMAIRGSPMSAALSTTPSGRSELPDFAFMLDAPLGQLRSDWLGFPKVKLVPERRFRQVPCVASVWMARLARVSGRLRKPANATGAKAEISSVFTFLPLVVQRPTVLRIKSAKNSKSSSAAARKTSSAVISNWGYLLMRRDQQVRRCAAPTLQAPLASLHQNCDVDRRQPHRSVSPKCGLARPRWFVG